MPSPAIRILNISKHFDGGEMPVIALQDLSLTIEQGERAAIIGPSGSGKTTLLNLIGALDRPDTGSIDCLGTDITRITERDAARFRKSKVGLVFQDDALMPELTVQENVELPLVLLRESKALRAEKVAAILETLGLSNRAHAFPATLSGGEKQRVAVARAVIHEPKLLLADEPTANLDTASALRVLDTIDNLAAQKGLTVILSTHDARVFERFPRIIRLEDGRISP